MRHLSFDGEGLPCVRAWGIGELDGRFLHSQGPSPGGLACAGASVGDSLPCSGLVRALYKGFLEETGSSWDVNSGEEEEQSEAWMGHLARREGGGLWPSRRPASQGPGVLQEAPAATCGGLNSWENRSHLDQV